MGVTYFSRSLTGATYYQECDSLEQAVRLAAFDQNNAYSNIVADRIETDDQTYYACDVHDLIDEMERKQNTEKAQG